MVGQLLDSHPELRDSREWYLPDSWVRKLGQACEAGNEAVIRELVARDGRLLVHTFRDDSVHKGKTALQLAVLSSNPRSLEVVVELLEQRKRGLALVALLQVNAQGHSPLHQAILAHRDRDTLLQIMAWMGERLDMIAAPEHWPLAQNIAPPGSDPLALQTLDMLNELLLWSVEHSDPAKVGCLLRLRASPNVCDGGKTVLYLAVAKLVAARDEEAAAQRGQLLLAGGDPHASNKDAEKDEAKLPRGTEEVRLLLHGGANPNALNANDEDSPLHLALRNGLLEIAEALLAAKADLNLKLRDGTTPLHCAAKRGSVTTLRWLVSKGAQLTVVNAIRQGVLHIATLHSHTEFAEEVQEAAKRQGVAQSLGLSDHFGNTPLHLAAQANTIAMMKWLVECGALPLRNRAGHLPRQVAASLGHSAWVTAYDETMATLKAKREALMAEQSEPARQLFLMQQNMIEMLEARLVQQEEKNREFKQLQQHVARLLGREQEFVRMKGILRPVIDAQKASIIDRTIKFDTPSLLQHVVRGEYQLAWNLMESNPEVVYHKGEVTDLSKRTFEKITAFQYAVWALDWRMWEIMLMFLPKEDARLQYNELQEGGVHADWQLLISAYNALIKSPNNGSVAQVAKAQRALPVHAMREYARKQTPLPPMPEAGLGSPAHLANEYTEEKYSPLQIQTMYDGALLWVRSASGARGFNPKSEALGALNLDLELLTALLHECWKKRVNLGQTL